MKKIFIYAPVDCQVKSIEESSDEAFSSKALGEGLLIIPKEQLFVSPFENAQVVMVFETKHAYGFETEGVKFLIHCGIDTVNLKGTPFETKLKVNQKVKKGDEIFKVDLQLIRNSDLSIETPIVFETNDMKNMQLAIIEKSEFKKGELIATLTFEENINNSEYEVKEFKSKYRLAAEEFVKAVGGKANFKEVYNCMTRLRFAIIDKTKVNTEIIGKNQLVKGVVWNGLELQVIIGGECYKVKDEILALNTNQTKKVNKNDI